MALCCAPNVYSESSPTKELTYQLNVQVSGLTPSKGQVILSIFDKEDRFLRTPLATQTAGVESESQLFFQFTGLKPGWYALAAIYDLNNNDELDTNFFGIPSEPVGASNDAKSLFGPPSFSDAKFEINQNSSHTIVMSKVKN